MPRLPAPIKYITVAGNNANLALSTEDNGIHILDQQLKQIQLVQQFFTSVTHEAGITYDERSKSLVSNSICGHIQFFRLHDKAILHSVYLPFCFK